MVEAEHPPGLIAALCGECGTGDRVKDRIRCCHRRSDRLIMADAETASVPTDQIGGDRHGNMRSELFRSDISRYCCDEIIKAVHGAFSGRSLKRRIGVARGLKKRRFFGWPIDRKPNAVRSGVGSCVYPTDWRWTCGRARRRVTAACGRERR